MSAHQENTGKLFDQSVNGRLGFPPFKAQQAFCSCHMCCVYHSFISQLLVSDFVSLVCECHSLDSRCLSWYVAGKDSTSETDRSQLSSVSYPTTGLDRSNREAFLSTPLQAHRPTGSTMVGQTSVVFSESTMMDALSQDDSRLGNGSLHLLVRTENESLGPSLVGSLVSATPVTENNQLKEEDPLTTAVLDRTVVTPTEAVLSYDACTPGTTEVTTSCGNVLEFDAIVKSMQSGGTAGLAFSRTIDHDDDDHNKDDHVEVVIDSNNENEEEDDDDDEEEEEEHQESVSFLYMPVTVRSYRPVDSSDFGRGTEIQYNTLYGLGMGRTDTGIAESFVSIEEDLNYILSNFVVVLVVLALTCFASMVPASAWITSSITVPVSRLGLLVTKINRYVMKNSRVCSVRMSGSSTICAGVLRFWGGESAVTITVSASVFVSVFVSASHALSHIDIFNCFPSLPLFVISITMLVSNAVWRQSPNFPSS